MLANHHIRVSLLPFFLQVTVAHLVHDYSSFQDSLGNEALPSNLTERAVTQCGPAYGNAVCDPSQCCAPDGTCGTGGYYCFAPACLFPYGPACDANAIPPGTNTSSIPRPQFGNIPYGTGIYHCTTPGKVALTFDDGPWVYTSDLLDILKSNNVKATFFMVANNNGKGQIEQESTPWPAIMRRVLNEGHQIASHTWSHQDLSTLTAQQITDQVIKNEIAFADVLGYFPTYLRPPYESCNSLCQSILGGLGYHVLNYDLDTLDWQENYPNSKNIFSSALKAGNPASSSFISLTHDIHNGTVYGFVQYMIDTLHAQGYTTALVGDCLGDPSSNWYRDAKTGQQWSGVLPGGSSSAAQPSSTSTTSQTPTSTSTSSTQPTTSSTTTSSPSSLTSSTSHTQTSAPIALPDVISSHSSNSTRFLSNITSTHSATTTASSGCGSNVAGCVYQGIGGTATPSNNTSSATSSSAGQASASKVGSSDGVNSAPSTLFVVGLVMAFTVLSAVV